MTSYPSINIQSSITPTNMYTPRQTRGATNNAIASAQQGAQNYELRKRFMTPGFSGSMSRQRNTMPGLVQGAMNATDAAVNVPFGDQAANAQHWFAGEQAREGQAQGWGGLGFNQLAQAQGLANQKQDMGWALLNQIMGY